VLAFRPHPIAAAPFPRNRDRMPAAFLLTLRQLGDPAFLGPLLKGFLGALLAFLGLAALAAWGVGELAGGSGWLAALAAAAAGCSRSASRCGCSCR
jgi:hypothetical protein